MYNIKYCTPPPPNDKNGFQPVIYTQDEKQGVLPTSERFQYYQTGAVLVLLERSSYLV